MGNRQSNITQTEESEIESGINQGYDNTAHHHGDR